ncbi:MULTISPECIES: L-histidine N(alpha)-methyltransferase [Micromonospora]|jgi:L-histidine N-alpha-methyltransferase|uniref:Histidine N-alpha-methyltransferase n=1 Tax=Micromonospora carbonacea TaxID=47853 RepID=A0A7H8XQ24_9ACTN|nr:MULTISPECIES: L-histidine N(alpha)-methyltransferase [Micromonospora]MBB5826438.1 L-histidine N-alpha-methyltransferase [Micromonospora carbonacea]MDG4819618.1 L-histidine N(alpha)-methyltransferase [Micromonospora sp. WMMD956]QLD25962.1 L-histidine N(alpha)-methyltransferase [Micromonospora carbonacea]
MSAEPLEIYLEEQDLGRSLRDDVRTGLTARPKWLPPKWFYDARGSELFEEITRLPEYYPTRAERSVLARRAGDVAELTGAKTLIELGSGSSEKTRLLLDAFTRRGGLGTFVPLDVSVSALRQSTEQIATDYPGLRVRGIVGDFTRHLDRLPTGGRRLVIFLGGTIGNLLPAERAGFLAAMRASLEPGDWLLIGTDLVKDPSIVVPAYDDAAGVTAEFNRNVLRVVNRELGADFDPEAFAHVALWDPEQEWIEMRLRAERPVRARVLDLDVEFAAGEELRTEVSAKFRPAGIAGELAAAGFTAREFWTDADGLFGVTLARAD